MRFREAAESDIQAVVGLMDGRNALPLEPRMRHALPFLLGRLLSSPACTLTIFEEDGPSGARAVSFRRRFPGWCQRCCGTCSTAVNPC